jgi:hypothetical protein
MATTVHEEKSIKLIDGTEIKVRPLKISLLRPFMKKFEGIAGVADDNEKSMTLLMECVIRRYGCSRRNFRSSNSL